MGHVPQGGRRTARPLLPAGNMPIVLQSSGMKNSLNHALFVLLCTHVSAVPSSFQGIGAPTRRSDTDVVQLTLSLPAPWRVGAQVQLMSRGWCESQLWLGRCPRNKNSSFRALSELSHLSHALLRGGACAQLFWTSPLAHDVYVPQGGRQSTAQRLSFCL